MKNSILILVICFISKSAAAQNELYNNGTTLLINTGCIVQINGSFVNKTGSTLTNNGTIAVTGNITNDVAGVFNAGTLEFRGTAAQTLSGTADYNAKNVLINNPAGVTLNARLKVDGLCTFANGIITAGTPATPVLFTATGSHNGAADASHVNGYVVKEGTGSFTYPVGNGIRYEQADVNLSANATGMQVRYNASDAGAGAFTSGGSEATPLISYNTGEHWDISPLSTATGTVTIYWDGYNDANVTALTFRKVAHKTAGNWVNEGTTATGTTAAGSITSNSTSIWSPFTMGIAGNVLPLQWLNVNGTLSNRKQAVLNFKVNESNVATYEIEKSNDGRIFSTIATISSKGDGENTYQFTDAVATEGKQYFRIRQVDKDGRSGYSSIITLTNQHNSTLVVYPNPVKDMVSISGATTGSVLLLTDINGKVLQQIKSKQSSFRIDMSRYSSGIYLLKTNDGVTQKLVKQ